MESTEMVFIRPPPQNLQNTNYPPITHLKQSNHKATPPNPINFPNSDYKALISYNGCTFIGERSFHSSWKISNHRSSSDYKLHSLHIITIGKTGNINRSKTVRLWSPVHITASTYKMLNTKKLPLDNTIWLQQPSVFLLSIEDQRGKNPRIQHDYKRMHGCCFSSWPVVARWSLF